VFKYISIVEEFSSTRVYLLFFVKGVMEDVELSLEITELLNNCVKELRNKKRTRRNLNGDIPKIREFFKYLDDYQEMHSLLKDWPRAVDFLVGVYLRGDEVNYRGKNYTVYGLCVTGRGLEAYFPVQDEQDTISRNDVKLSSCKVSPSLALEFARERGWSYQKIRDDFRKSLEETVGHMLI